MTQISQIPGGGRARALGAGVLSLLNQARRVRPPSWRPPSWRGQAVLPPYTDDARSLSRRLVMTLQLIGLILFCVVYGMAFGLFYDGLLAVVILPVVVLLGLVVWALPEARTAPVRTLGALFFVTSATLFVWPNYLAIVLPGLPWITVSRLAEAPMVIVLGYCLSTSRSFRQRLWDIVNTSPAIWMLLVAFVAVQVLTIPFSHSPGNSLEKFLNAQISWTAAFFIAAYVFSRKGSPTRWAVLLWIGAIFVGVLAIWEHQLRHVIWRDHIPSFLQISDPSVINDLNTVRSAFDNRIRSQATFDGPGQLGEFVALCFVFVLHFACAARNRVLRIWACISVPCLLGASLLTGSRSSFVGLFGAIGLYSLYLGLRWWRRNPRHLLVPLFFLSLPVGGVVGLASTFVVGALRKRIWGGAAAQSSTQGRLIELNLALPKITSHPWGYGIGQSALVVGYAPNGVLTIDSYYLTLLLEYGVVGFIIWMALFLYAAGDAGVHAVFATAEDEEIGLLAPAAIAVVSFVIIKSVFSQQDNHLYFFALLGMIVALIWRSKAKGDAQALPPPSKRRPSAIAALKTS